MQQNQDGSISDTSKDTETCNEKENEKEKPGKGTVTPRYIIKKM